MGILSRIYAFSRRRIESSAEHCIVDNRVFLLGLDKFYRDAVKQHERGELLSCARCIAHKLDVTPSPPPVEGYYAEDEQLTEYFRLMRGLQNVDAQRTPEVVALAEFQRLTNVMASPLYGRPQQTDKLLPAGRDALSQALDDTSPEWTVARLVAAANDAARQWDDISLVGLAARCRDAVVLGALRESVVLYAQVSILGFSPSPRREFVWQVDPELVRHANRFIETFKALFGDELPAAVPNAAGAYWLACEDNRVEGRCVRIGADATGGHYHWGIFRGLDGVLRVQEFWHDEIWTTTRYRDAFRSTGGPPNL
jgi:hypothetical protein